MPSAETSYLDQQIAQQEFLASGGVLRRALLHKYKTGEILRTYTHHEYPKVLRFNEREVEVEQPYLIGNENSPRMSYVFRKIADEFIVHSEDEEAQARELAAEANTLGVKFVPGWTLAVLNDQVKLARRHGAKPVPAASGAASRGDNVLAAPAPAADAARLDRLEAMLTALLTSRSGAVAPAAPMVTANPQDDAEDERRLAEIAARVEEVTQGDDPAPRSQRRRAPGPAA